MMSALADLLYETSTYHPFFSPPLNQSDTNFRCNAWLRFLEDCIHVDHNIIIPRPTNPTTILRGGNLCQFNTVFHSSANLKILSGFEAVCLAMWPPTMCHAYYTRRSTSSLWHRPADVFSFFRLCASELPNIAAYL